MNKLIERCCAICGEDRSGCFAENANHLECVTDIIVNKIWAARAIIEMGARESACEQMSGILNLATKDMDELIDWVKRMPTLQAGEIKEEDRGAVCSR
ncbi:MAG: hypothetical protein ACYC7L_05600 [Nitrospirota bacterium]